MVNQGGRRHPVQAAGIVVRGVLGKINGTILTERVNRLAVRGIQLNQPAVECSNDDALFMAFFPKGRTAIDKQVVRAVLIQVRIVRPERLSRFRIESNDPREGRGDVHHLIHQQRRAFKGGPEVERRTVTDVAGVIGPGDFQAGYVLTIDLGERRVFGSPQIAAVMRPLLGGAATALKSAARKMPRQIRL